MPARVMLLVLTVGLFVAIWSSDRGRVGKTPARQAVAHRPDADPRDVTASRRRRRTPIAAPRPGPQRLAAHSTPLTPRPKPAVSPRSGVETGHGVVNPPAAAHSTTASTSEVSARQIPLPGGLTPGEYRVVRSDGQVMRLRLTSAELARRGLSVPKRPVEFRMLHDGRLRWYFVRISSRGALPAGFDAVRATNETLKPVVARKPSRRPVVAGRPNRRAANATMWRFARSRWNEFTVRIRSAQRAAMNLPMDAGRFWWAAMRANLQRWTGERMSPDRTAGKNHPLRD